MLAQTIITAVLLGVSPSTSATVDSQLHQVEQNIVHYTNLQRQRHGLRPLTIDQRLVAAARQHCSWMARNGSLVHTSASVAENIAMGQNNSLEAVRDWMNSPGHRANILNGSYRRVGAAAYTGAGGQVFWCLQLLH